MRSGAAWVALAVAVVAAIGMVVCMSREDPAPVVRPAIRDPGPLVRKPAEEVVVVPLPAEDVGSTPDESVVSAPVVRAGAVPSAGCDAEIPGIGHAGFANQSHRFLPSGYDGKTPLPLVVMLHADYQDPAHFMDATDFPTRAERDGVILVALADGNLVGGHVWRDGDEDLAKIVARVDQALAEFCVDRARVFVLGHGDGGRMAHRVSCRPSVAAIAVNSFSLNDSGYLCDRPVPALWLHPMKSVHMPRDGSPNCSGRVKRTPDEMEKMWLERNRCHGAGDVSVTYGASSCRRWDCDEGFEMCRLDGGVPWPGTAAEAFTELMGCPPDTAPDFPVSARIWEFLVHAPPLANVPETF